MLKSAEATLVTRKSAYLFVFQIVTLLALSVPAAAVLAQPIADSSAVKLETMRLGINTFSLGTVSDYRTMLSPGSTMKAGLGQYAVYNRALASSPFITNNLLANLQYARSLGKKWKWVNDTWQASYFANRTRQAEVMSRVRYSIIETNATRLFVQGGIGILNDKRLTYNNTGPTAEILAEYSGQADSTLFFGATTSAVRAYIEPRQNERWQASLLATKLFPDGGLLSGEAGVLKRKVEDFLGSDIQSIVSDTLYFRARLQYGIAKGLLFSSQNEYLTPNRSFFYRNAETQTETRNVRYAQQEYQTLNTISYQNSQAKASFSFESKQRNRAYDILKRFSQSDPNYLVQLAQYNQKLEEEQIKDITEQYTTYTTDLRWKLARKHLLKLNYVAQLLRVDTKSDLNNQDRDEILYAGELAHEWKISPGFTLIQKISASLRHLIFIEASQSSENFKDRILRWEPGFRIRFKKLNWNGQMGIWATYQVRDFESEQERNRSNRVLLFAHQLDYTLSPHWKIFGDFLRRENRLSQLNWEGFSESPIDTVTIYDLSAKPQLQWSKNGTEWAFQLGYRAYWQIRKSKASLTDPAVGARLIYLRNYIVQQGPQLKLIWNKSLRLRLQAEFWLQWSTQYNRYQRSEEIYLGTSYTKEALAVVDSRFLPYFTISALWHLNNK